MSGKVHMSHCKSWLGNDRWFETQGRAAKPATHTFLCGGVAVLHNEDEFVELYGGVARDVLENEGRVSICENFPRITGSWPSRCFPPPHLIHRAVKLLRFSEDAIPAYLIDEERCRDDERINTLKQIEMWTLCAFAMDFDYKEITNGQWSLDDIIADVRVIQRVILECGRYKLRKQSDVASCLICIAYDSKQKLGLHLYFPYTRYYPEECMHLAAICISRLQEERPVLQGCTRSWHEIVDLIYNHSLRLPLVQKAKECDACKNNPRKRRQCQNCHHRGIVWDDRRYYPVGMMDGNGEWMGKENMWIDPMVDFIRREPGFSQQFRADHLIAKSLPYRCETSAITADVEAGLMSEEKNDMAVQAQVAAMVEKLLGRQQRRLTVDKRKCAEYIVMFLNICSLRINTNMGHTLFRPSKMMPRPNYPRSWVHYFQSVVHALEPSPTLSNAFSLDELNDRVLAMRLSNNIQTSIIKNNLKNNIHNNTTTLPVVSGLVRLQITGDELTPIQSTTTTTTTNTITATTTRDEKADGHNGMDDGDDQDVKVLDGVEAEIAEIVRRLAVLRLQPAPWSNPGGVLGTENHTITKDRESWEDRAWRSKFSHLFLTRMDDVEVVRKMATGIFNEFKEVETISNDPEGRCKRLQAYIRQEGAPYYSQIQIIKIHISLKFKNSLVQVDGPGRHYCHIAGRNHRRNVITFQVRRQGQVLFQHCFHPKCAGRHHNMGAIKQFDIRVLFAPEDTLKSCENKAPQEAIDLAKNLQKTSLAHSTAVPKRTRRKTTVEQTPPASAEHDALQDDLPSKFGPNAPPPIPIPKKLTIPTKKQTETKQDSKETKEMKKSEENDEEEEFEPPESPYDFSDLDDEDEPEEKEIVTTNTTNNTTPDSKIKPLPPIKMNFDEILLPPPPPPPPPPPTAALAAPVPVAVVVPPPSAQPSTQPVVSFTNTSVVEEKVKESKGDKGDGKRSEPAAELLPKKRSTTKRKEDPPLKKSRKSKASPPTTVASAPASAPAGASVVPPAVFELTANGLPLPTLPLTTVELNAAATLQILNKQ